MSSYDKKKGEGFEAVIVLALVPIIIMVVMWVVGSAKIITFWAPIFYSVSRMWTWLPGNLLNDHVAELYAQGAAFLRNPTEASLLQWIVWVNFCIQPLTILLTLAAGVGVGFAMTRKRLNLKRTFTPLELATHLSYRFTGTAPILHLTKDLAKNKDPKWRRQTFPHEVLLGTKVNGKPLVVDNVAQEDRIEEYFRGIEMKREGGRLVPRTIEGRLVSSMLGRQIVDLVSDRGRGDVVFADRMSSPGKVLFALLTAYAFGGEEGKEDYGKARDQLNNSCRGAPSGLPNLKVAQWIFDKYRTNAQARKVLAVHHWEITILWALLVHAKKQGKAGHWEFLWLKPLARIMFYSLNTVGRLTPHTESAAAFSQYIYERRVARRRRLPLLARPDGGYVHVIYVKKAVKGLMAEWAKWLDGADEEGDWWMREDVWHALSKIDLGAPPLPPPEALVGDTPFDMAMRADAKRSAEEESRGMEAALAAAAAADAAAGGGRQPAGEATW